jgi:hypothetical protein
VLTDGGYARRYLAASRAAARRARPGSSFPGLGCQPLRRAGTTRWSLTGLRCLTRDLRIHAEIVERARNNCQSDRARLDAARDRPVVVGRWSPATAPMTSHTMSSSDPIRIATAESPRSPGGLSDGCLVIRRSEVSWDTDPAALWTHRPGRSERLSLRDRSTTDSQIIGREDVGSASGPASRVVSRLGRSVGGLGPGLTSESADAALGLSLETICRPGPRLWHPPALPV